MTRAVCLDIQHLASSLAGAFDDNKSVNYLVKQDASYWKRLLRRNIYSTSVIERLVSTFPHQYPSDARKDFSLLFGPVGKQLQRSLFAEIAYGKSPGAGTSYKPSFSRIN